MASSTRLAFSTTQLTINPTNNLTTGQYYVLIPAGARLLGETKPVQALGETRLAVAFHRLIMPDGSTLSLDHFLGLMLRAPFRLSREALKVFQPGACIVNIAADICQQRICSPQDLETAVTLGLGYPLGPLAMGNRWGPTNVLEVLFNLQTVYGDPRYRPSPLAAPARRHRAVALVRRRARELPVDARRLPRDG